MTHTNILLRITKSQKQQPEGSMVKKSSGNPFYHYVAECQKGFLLEAK